MGWMRGGGRGEGGGFTLSRVVRAVMRVGAFTLGIGREAILPVHV